MACSIALKRAIDLDNLHSPERSAKRRRTTNAGHCSPYQPPSSAASADKYPSVFDNVASKISSQELQSYLRSEVSSLRRRRLLPPKVHKSAGNARSSPSSPSSSSDSSSDGEQRMDDGQQRERRRQLDGRSSTQEFAAAAAAGNGDNQQQPALFTLKQVQLICERLLKEQENRLRGEYEQVLNAKLCEQYDSFVRFTYDQIHRRFEETQISYLS